MTDAALQEKATPRYAWACLGVTFFVSVSIVLTWFWPVGVTFDLMKPWLIANTPGFSFSGLSSIMGLTPIAAMIMAIPTSALVRKFGVKTTIIAGMLVAIVTGALQAIGAMYSFSLFLVARCLYGCGIAMTAVSGPTAVSIWFPSATRGRAMGIWSCWVPLGLIIINNIGSGLFGVFGNNLPAVIWFTVAVLACALVCFALVFRLPNADESSEVSAERKPFSEVAHFFKNRQLWCLIAAFLIFNYMNYNFSTYLKTWLAADPTSATGGMGMDLGLAGLLAGLITACGILAPIGGIILDKTKKKNQYLLVVIGVTALTLACVFSYRANNVAFIVYVAFFCLGNMLLNACCRPLVPSFLFKGGSTAVAMGLSFLTCAQYLGQVPMSYIMDALVGTGMTYSEATMAAFVPVGIVGIVLAFFVKPSKAKAVKEDGTAEKAQARA
ncbi:MAG: MFS transporter [Coriobacteriales bacterium]